jgi:FixJ family two-component response regulator
LILVPPPRDLAPGRFCFGHGELSMGVQAMKKGAIDFLTKPCDDEQLLGAVHRAMGKNRQVRVRYKEKQEIRRRIERLTLRENEILRYVIAGRLNKQIAGNLGIAEPTLKIHRGRTTEKPCAESVADLVRLDGKAEHHATRQRNPLTYA